MINTGGPAAPTTAGNEVAGDVAKNGEANDDDIEQESLNYLSLAL